ncbi:hypothetical protein [Mycolicibacterium llatzerense]|uniref:hypothetical protein n=1 Tax=Mycolicibacterium llatzerense TaxID=280871 RepID=UPI0013A6BBFB|nr:hypothetical protein [Mycolicibacterium llatzerense]
MTTQQQPNPEHQVLDVIAHLIDEQLAAGEPTVPAERQPFNQSAGTGNSEDG